MYKILQSIRDTNSTKEKQQILEANKDNKELQQVLKLTYDVVTYNYGLSLKTINHFKSERVKDKENSIELIKRLGLNPKSGNERISTIGNIIKLSSPKQAKLIKMIIDRSLKLGIGKTIINKVFKDLIIRPQYQRVSPLNEKTVKKMVYPLYCQKKQDGRYIQLTVSNGESASMTRQGENFDLPTYLSDDFKTLPDGVYLGELMVRSIPKDRAHANRLINSNNKPNDIYLVVWDLVSDKIYEDRFEALTKALSNNKYKHIQIVESEVVDSLDEAMTIANNYIKNGYEGCIIKNKSTLYKNGTSRDMLKIKNISSAEVEITGFIEGKLGTKREKTLGALTFKSSCGLVTGSTSGLSDTLLEEINNNRESYIGKIIEVQFNELTKDNKLLSPRFIEIRTDKVEANNLENIKDMMK